MKKKLILLFFLSCAIFSNAQVGINTTTPNASSVLDLNSHLGGTNYGGFMPPRVTLAQRNLIPVTAAQDGLIVYTSYPGGLRCLQLYNGSTLAWENITCFGIPPVIGTVFFESMGNASSLSILTHHANNGFDNSSTCTFTSSSSTAPQVRNTAPLSTSVFPSASGSGFLFLSNANREMTISGIDLTAHAGPLTLQLLIYKSTTTATGADLSITYFDGATNAWVDVSVSNLPTGTGTNTWHQRVLAVNVPNTIQRISFSRATTGPEYRIDDIEIINP